MHTTTTPTNAPATCTPQPHATAHLCLCLPGRRQKGALLKNVLQVQGVLVVARAPPAAAAVQAAAGAAGAEGVLRGVHRAGWHWVGFSLALLALGRCARQPPRLPPQGASQQQVLSQPQPGPGLMHNIKIHSTAQHNTAQHRAAQHSGVPTHPPVWRRKSQTQRTQRPSHRLHCCGWGRWRALCPWRGWWPCSVHEWGAQSAERGIPTGGRPARGCRRCCLAADTQQQERKQQEEKHINRGLQSPIVGGSPVCPP